MPAPDRAEAAARTWRPTWGVAGLGQRRRGERGMYTTIDDVMADYASHMDAHHVPEAERLNMDYVRELVHLLGRYEELDPAEVMEVLWDHTEHLLGMEIDANAQ